ncbi:MAG TPA: elongation factor P [Candidatus Saccharimonadales bacterium]
MALAITDLKKGVVFELDGIPYKVLEYNQKVVGRGGSIVNIRIKSLLDGKVLDKALKGNDQVNSADIAKKDVQFLYSDNDSFHFMDTTSFEQFTVPADFIEEQKYFLKENDMIQIQLFNNTPINIVIAKNVPLKVTYTEDVVKGDTATNLLKDATLETGLIIKVPPFIKQGDVIRVDTRTNEYLERER